MGLKSPAPQNAQRPGGRPEEPQKETAGCPMVLVERQQGFGGPKTGQEGRGRGIQRGNIFNQSGKGFGVDQTFGLQEAQKKIESDGEEKGQEEEDVLGTAGGKDV